MVEAKKMHYFQEDLRNSEEEVRDVRTEGELRGYFGSPPDFKADWGPRETPYIHDLEIRAWGATYRIEEKRRMADYTNELIENVSNSETGRPGWVWRAGSVDYIIFTFPKRHMHIWPGPALEAFWRKNSEAIVKRYGYIEAKNPKYRTLNVILPTSFLRRGVSDFGAPICPSCRRNVGAYRQSCAGCATLSCCHVSNDNRYVCIHCAS